LNCPAPGSHSQSRRLRRIDGGRKRASGKGSTLLGDAMLLVELSTRGNPMVIVDHC
jgi:hypothetical protein